LLNALVMHSSVALKNYPNDPYEVSAYSASRKATNDDSFFVGAFKPSMNVSDVSPGIRWRGEVTGPHRGVLMIVADGFGLNHGALASQTAIEEAAGFTLENVVAQKAPTRQGGADRQPTGLPRLTLPGLRDQLLDVVAASDEALREKGKTHGELESTLTLGYLLWPLLYIAHVGDSRAYIIKDAQLLQVTKDHSLGAQAAALGFDDIAGNWHNALWNCLGDPNRCAAPDLHKVVLEPHDRWLITSDGFHNFVSPSEILELTLGPQSAALISQSLVNRALKNGADDDVTVIFGRYLW
jgi:serine/threonine protein phosphatase PrpC